MKRLLICLAIWDLSSSTIKGNSAEEIGQWSACGPTGAKYILDLAIDPLTPTTLYVATYSLGIYKSTDSGSSWFVSNNGLPYTNTSYGIEAVSWPLILLRRPRFTRV